MKKIIRVKLLKDPGATGGFCMSVGSIVELYDGGFRNPEVNKDYYPLFGPYSCINEIAEQIINGTATQEAIDLFEVVDVTDIITPSQEHDIMDETGKIKICTINHKSFMTLLKDRSIERMRGCDVYMLSNPTYKNDVCEYDINLIDSNDTI